MIFYYVHSLNDNFTVYSNKSFIPEDKQYFEKDINELPTGEGILKMRENGEFYFAPYPPQPEVPQEPTPTPDPKPVDPMILQKQILVNTEYIIMLSELGGM